MTDFIYNILAPVYGRVYSYRYCGILAEQISERMQSREYTTRGDVMHYLWINTSGGDTAEMVSRRIMSAFPELLADVDEKTMFLGR